MERLVIRHEIRLSLTEARELEEAFCRNGWEWHEEFDALSKDHLLYDVRQVVRGEAVILPTKKPSLYVVINDTTIAVNLGVSPLEVHKHRDGTEVEQHIGEGWVIAEKRTDGLYVGGRKVILYLSEGQRNGKSISLRELREELVGKPLLNTNLLDALFCFENRHLLPKDWSEKARQLHFLGTILRFPSGQIWIRFAERCRYDHWRGRWTDWDWEYKGYTLSSADSETKFWDPECPMVMLES